MAIHDLRLAGRVSEPGKGPAKEWRKDFGGGFARDPAKDLRRDFSRERANDLGGDLVGVSATERRRDITRDLVRGFTRDLG